MKNKAEVLIESLNYVLIQYALSNMAFLFRANLLFVLFFASDFYVTGVFFNRLCARTGSRLAAVGVLLLCFAAYAALLWFAGRVSGTVVPFAAA